MQSTLFSTPLLNIHARPAPPPCGRGATAWQQRCRRPFFSPVFILLVFSLFFFISSFIVLYAWLAELWGVTFPSQPPPRASPASPLCLPFRPHFPCFSCCFQARNESTAYGFYFLIMTRTPRFMRGAGGRPGCGAAQIEPSCREPLLPWKWSYSEGVHKPRDSSVGAGGTTNFPAIF